MTVTQRAAKGTIKRNRDRKTGKTAGRADPDFQALADASLSGIIVFQGEHIVYVNQAAADIAGYTKDELLGMRFWEVMHPDFRDMARKHGLSRLRGEQADSRIEVKVSGKDGRERWLDSSTSRIEYNGLPAVLVSAVDITERKQAEEMLTGSQQMLQLVMDNIPQAVFWKDRNSIYLGCNRVLAMATGLETPENVRGKTDYDLPWSREQADYFRECDRRIMENDTPEYHIIEQQQESGGRNAWVETNKIPLHNDKGIVTGILGTYEDITERKHAEESLKKSEADLDRAQRIAALGSWEWDLKANTLSGSREYYRIFCMEPCGPVPFERFASMVHPDDRKRVNVATSDIRYEKLPGGFEFRLLTQSGEERYIHSEVEVVRDKNGRPVKVFGTMQDITERKKAEIALRESEEKFRVLAETSSALIWLFQGDHYVYVNDAVTFLTGYSKDELYHMKFWEIIHPDYRELIRVRGLARQRGEAVPSKYETRLLTKTGETRWVDVNAGRIEYKGKPAGIATLFDITERKQAEEALNKLRAKLEKSQEIAHLGSWELDLRDNSLSWSDEVYRIFGLQSREFDASYDAFLSAVHPDDREAVDAAYISSIRDGRDTYEFEHRIVRKSTGEVRFVHEKCQHFRSDSGQIIRSVGMVQDITERKQAEEAIKFANAYNRSLIEASLDPLLTIAPDGRITDVNAATEAATGYPRQKLIGTDFSDYFYDPEKAREGYRKVFEEGSVIDYPLEIKREDGHITPVLYNATVYRDETGKVIGIFAAARDVTRRKRAEEALRGSEALLDSIFRSAPTGIGLVLDRVIIKVNDKLCQMTGYSREELLGKDARLFYPSDEEYKHVGKVKYDMIAERGVGEVETCWRRKDGTLIDILLSSSPIVPDDLSAGVTFTALDITMRKRAEDEVREAKSQAELYLDLLGHDINNMHQIALGYLELARDMPASGGQNEYLDKPIEVLQRSARLIKNVRKLQKLQEGVFLTQEVDVAAVLSDVKREFGAVPGKTITLNMNGCEHCHVRANGLLYDVFANLVSNAIKHTGDHAEIVIDLDIVKDNRDRYCRVMVEDNGPGIPDDFKGRIFNRMLRGDTKAKGMGLGLYLVKSLVESYAGRVWVEDRITDDHTKGARFVVMLPASQQ